MNNSTTASPPSVSVFVAYASQGAVIAGANLIIVIAILRYKALRNNKEYLLMLGVSLADTINQTGYAVSGLYNIYLLLTRGPEDHQKITITDCMRMLHPLFLQYGIGLGPLMLLALSADRLICVLSPLTYVGWTVSYARRLIASVFLLKLTDIIYFYSTSLGKDGDHLVSATCAMAEIRPIISPRPYITFRKLYTPFFALSSVFIYFVVIFIHKRSTNNVNPVGHPHQQYELKRQRKVTITLWVSALCTLFLFVLPYSVGIVLLTKGNNVGLLFFNLSNANHIASVFLYPLRHEEMVQALKAMFKCKHMPDDIRMWKEAKTPKHQPSKRHQADSKNKALVPRGPLANSSAPNTAHNPPNFVEAIELA